MATPASCCTAVFHPAPMLHRLNLAPVELHMYLIEDLVVHNFDHASVLVYNSEIFTFLS